ncbi:hypothetical protein PVK06_008664 [Gossypium arboreum]|uniref:Uncharacterized protein n=1 Tax=Gossypium arboreum TaxID=29729 RepID=A0ABR0QLG4_GOSAR|nr:hypothetical protein PVK06_008664 [Gossypium arboreum]
MKYRVVMIPRVVTTATFESIASGCVFDFFVNFILKGYIKNFEVHDPHRVGRITVDLQGRWGYVVISTPDGVLDHEEAIQRNVGGQVLGYFH